MARRGTKTQGTRRQQRRKGVAGQAKIRASLAGQVRDYQRRSRALYEISKTLRRPDYALADVLRLILDVAVQLSNARYGALGVFDESGKRLADFLVVGIDPTTKSAIGTFPTGRGLLGSLDWEGDVVRLKDLTQHPAFTGFPPHHPPMRSFLGASIRANGRLFGRLYLTDKKGQKQAFSKLDEQTIAALAVHAGLAIEDRQFVERIQAAEALYRSTMASLSVSVVRLDQEGAIRFANPCFYELIQRDEADVVGRPIASVLLVDGRGEGMGELLDRVCALSEPVTREVHWVSPAGEPRVLQASIAGMHPAAAAAAAAADLVLIIEDVTERKRTEEQLREQKERFQQLAEAVSEVFWMSTRDLTEILYVSPAYETVWRRSCRSLYERPLSFLESIHPDDRGRVQAEVRERQIDRGEPFAHEYRIVWPDGSIRWIWDRGFPVLNATGAIGRFAGIAVDITERKRMDDILRQRTEQLHAINDSLLRLVQFENWQEAGEALLRSALHQTGSKYGFVGVVVEGPALRILAHAGVVWDQVENREFYEQALRTYQEKGYLEFTNFNNLFGRVITGKQVVLSNEPAADPRAGGLPPGHPPLRQFLGVPILREAEVIGLIGLANRPGGYTGAECEQVETLIEAARVLCDRYRRSLDDQRMEHHLRQAEKMAAMGMLIAGVSHELNNPLFALSGYLELAAEKVRSGEHEGLAEDLAAMEEAVERATAMVRRFLGVARSRASRREPCAVNVLVEEGLELVANDCQIHGIRISRALAPDLPLLEVDSQELLQVLLNLLTNARQAMAAQGRGTLTVTTALAVSPHPPGLPSASSGTWVEIRVQDDGPGIAPEHVGRIFEPFFTTKPVGEGTGLGLSTSHRIITEHGGALTCQSEPGRGATFMVWLPVGTSDQQATER